MLEEPDLNRKPFGLIYLITNKINGNQYVGQTRALDTFKTYWGSGKILIRAMRKNGRENFSKEIILYSYENQEELDALERFYIEEYNTLVPNGYNIEKGGGGPRISEEANEERKRKVSAAKAGIPVLKKIPLSAQSRIQIGETHKYRNLNDPEYRKMVEERGARVGWNREVKYRSQIPIEEMVILYSQGENMLTIMNRINSEYGTSYSCCLLPKLFEILNIPLFSDREKGTKTLRGENREKRINWAKENQDIIELGLQKYRELYPHAET